MDKPDKKFLDIDINGAEWFSGTSKKLKQYKSEVKEKWRQNAKKRLATGPLREAVAFKISGWGDGQEFAELRFQKTRDLAFTVNNIALLREYSEGGFISRETEEGMLAKAEKEIEKLLPDLAQQIDYVKNLYFPDIFPGLLFGDGLLSLTEDREDEIAKAITKRDHDSLKRISWLLLWMADFPFGIPGLKAVKQARKRKAQRGRPADKIIADMLNAARESNIGIPALVRAAAAEKIPFDGIDWSTNPRKAKKTLHNRLKTADKRLRKKARNRTKNK